LVTKTFAGRS